MKRSTLQVEVLIIEQLEDALSKVLGQGASSVVMSFVNLFRTCLLGGKFGVYLLFYQRGSRGFKTHTRLKTFKIHHE